LEKPETRAKSYKKRRGIFEKLTCLAIALERSQGGGITPPHKANATKKGSPRKGFGKNIGELPTIHPSKS